MHRTLPKRCDHGGVFITRRPVDVLVDLLTDLFIFTYGQSILVDFPGRQ